MSPSRRSRLVGTGLALATVLLLAGCGPVPVGLTAVSMRDGHLVIAVMRSDDTALRHASVEHPGPLRDDAPREYFDDGRWTTDQDDHDIIVLDTSAPGKKWTTEKALGALDPEVRYSAGAGGGFDDPMGYVGFRLAELEGLEEGQWLYDVGSDQQDAVVRPTSTDLRELREQGCP
jgi:hypothetical protein